MKTARRTELQDTLHRKGEGALRKYANLTIGEGAMPALIRYELLTFLFGIIPGAAGILLRRVFYRRLFGSMGRNVILGRGITIRHPAKIFLADNVAVDDFCVLDARGGPHSAIRLGDGCVIGRNTILRTKDGKIVLSAGGSIGANCILSSSSTLEAGENLLLASSAYVIAGGQHVTERVDIPIIAQGMVSKGGITIGDNVWIGGRVTILDGVNIGHDAIIGACSLVNKSVPPFGVAHGVPARVVRDRRETSPPPGKERETEK